MKKAILYALAAVLVLGGSAVAGGLWYVHSARPEYGRDARLPGLSAPVEVWRDSLAVPHIRAENELDLARALGYVHAQERLWQMELFRRVADGRLAEVLGPPALSSDRFLRTLGMGRAAADAERLLDPESRARMQAYADGVNHYLRERPGALPPEFVALRFEPEPWTVRHSLAIGKIMAWDLADWDVGLALARAEAVVGPELAADLHPRYPEWGVDILGPEARWAGAAAPPAPAPLGRPATLLPPERLPTIPPLARRLLDAGSAVRASNSWVVAGSRTRSGRPILANDPHLALRAPSLWMLAALHGGPTRAAGVTIPGVPVVVLGHTDAVAWGFTNAMVDDVDFYVERVHPDDPDRYLTPAGWRGMAVREETIQVRGGEPVAHRVRVTRHGPVLSDVDDRAGDLVLAMRWTGLEPSGEHRALIAMNRARSAAELVEALRSFDAPHQNVVFADTAGHIGYRLVGRVPVRRAGDGLLPAPGWTDEHAWERDLRFDEHPHLLDPAEGFIVTANNRQLSPASGYPFRIGSNYAEPFRAMRIREMLQGARALTAADVARQQADVVDRFALRYRDHAVRAAEAAGAPAAAADLRAWNGAATADSRPAALFYVWYEQLRRRVGADEYGDGPMYFPREAMNAILDAAGGRWVDDVRTPGTETLDGLAREAMRGALAETAGKRWGELHTTRMEHVLGVSELLDDALELNIGPFPNGGSPYTVDVASYGSRLPFTNAYGASMRHVVDLGDPDASGGFVLPTGQSGHPLSPHYRDQTELWRQGRLWLVPLHRAAAEARAVERMRLVP